MIANVGSIDLNDIFIYCHVLLIVATYHIIVILFIVVIISKQLTDSIIVGQNGNQHVFRGQTDRREDAWVWRDLWL